MHMSLWIRVGLAAALLALAPVASHAAGITVFAAASLSDALSDIGKAAIARLTALQTDRGKQIDEHALGQSKAELDSDTDRYGTGEAASSEGDNNFEADSDILPDEVEGEARALRDDSADPARDEEDL